MIKLKNNIHLKANVVHLHPWQNSNIKSYILKQFVTYLFILVYNFVSKCLLVEI